MAGLGAASTWYMGWFFTLLCWFVWLFVMFGIDALWNGSTYRPDNYGPMVWAGFPAMCMGFFFSIWGAIKVDKKIEASPEKPYVNRYQSFWTIAVIVLVAQSICYSPCLSQSGGAMAFTEFFLFPVLCAGYSGFVIFQRHSNEAKNS
jgi:hypothetical protein